MNAICLHGASFDDGVVKYIFRLCMGVQYTFGNSYQFIFVFNQCINKNIFIMKTLFFWHDLYSVLHRIVLPLMAT